ncbi:alpha/beta hydrolase [Advenella sp. S44]|nr:alpha/beta hydrolase [Advenella sp. S44]
MVPNPVAAKASHIVLVHGMNMDGGAWRAVYDQLTHDNYRVSVVQLPMTSMEDDIAAARRAIDAHGDSVVLVGHSYGGMVISQVGTESDVKALVYIAAFQPEVGESLADLNASMPAKMPQEAIQLMDDGYYVVEPDAWISNVANGLSEADARYTAMFQTPANTSIFNDKANAAAWHDKPVWAAVATADRTLAPELQRKMSKRSGAKVIEIAGGHLLLISHPGEVAALIKQAATSVD